MSDIINNTEQANLHLVDTIKIDTNPPAVGSCEIYFGPMFAKKTTLMTHDISTYSDLGFKTLYINSQLDERVTTSVTENATSHSSQFRGLPATVDTIKVSNLSMVDVSPYQVIGIDEAQFFDDLELCVRKWVLELHKKVIIASLDGDVDMKPFGQAHRLICLCEPGMVRKLGAICEGCLVVERPYLRMSTVPTGFTRSRKTKVKNESKSNIDVGGKDKYLPVCMKCALDTNF